MAYFDNAATTYPKPDMVYAFMDSFYRECGGSAGRGNHNAAVSAGTLVKETRQLLQSLFHNTTKQVVFTPSATISLNMIIQGLLQTEAQNVYISPFEHNAVTRNLHHFEKTGTVKVFQLAVRDNFTFDLERIKYQFDSNKPDLVIISHASNVFGLIAPVADIFAVAKKYHATTIVDMAQTAGLVDLNLNSLDIDLAVFAGHKTLYAPTGIAGFLMKQEINLPPVLFGGTGFDSANQDMPKTLPERYEMGTLNLSGIAGLNASIRWIEETGMENLWQKEQEHRQRLLEILSNHPFIKLVGVNNENQYVGIVSCLIDGIPSDTAGTIFNQHGISVRTGLQCAPLAHQFLGTYPAGTIRFSTSYFTSEDDFQQLNTALDYIEDNL